MKIQIVRIWTRISRNPVLSGVVATLLAAVAVGLVSTADAMLTKTSPPPPVEHAEIRGGEWGPSRVVYRCMPSGRCVAPDRVVFDSITGASAVGNGPYFMSAKVLGSAGPMQSRLEVHVGDTVVVRALIENDAAVNARNERSLVARNTRFSLSIPTNSSSELPLIGHITASNAVPRSIYDGIFIHATRRFNIEYDWGSTRLSNRTHKLVPLDDEIVGEGVLVGSGTPDGTFPPGLSNSAAVFFLVRILPATS
jgi:hypothetical protein